MNSLFEIVSWQWLVVGLQALVAPLAAGHVIVRKRDSRSALGWIGLIMVFPLFGPVFYYLFGINRVRTRARQLLEERGGEEDHNALPISLEPLPADAGSLKALACISDTVSERPRLPGNTAELLSNGDEAYPAMLDAIGKATRSVYLMSYIMNDDPVGQTFADSLSDAVKRGLEVKVLIDGMGEHYSRRLISRILRRRGVPVARFLPPRFIPLSLHVNLRNHRKILVTDWNTAFTGGMNIAKRHLVANPEVKNPTRDLHFRFAGPVVAQFYEVFSASWNFATGQNIARTVPLPAAQGSMVCRTISDGPDEDLDKLSQILVGSVAAAREKVQILTPYFLPSRELIGALQAASLRGVQVQVVLPGRSNLPFIDWATRKMLWEIVLRGVQVFYQPAPFDHAKLWVIDNHYVLLGSANIDPRSLRLNFETGTEVYDRDFGNCCSSHIDQLIKASQPVSQSELENRRLPSRLRDGFFWLFSPYL